MNVLLSIGIVVAMLACVALIPLGLPGLWLIAAGALVLVGTSSSSSLDAHFVGRAAELRKLADKACFAEAPPPRRSLNLDE